MTAKFSTITSADWERSIKDARSRPNVAMEQIRAKLQSSARERAILMSAPMVRALLNGTKAQTRRIVKPQPTSGVTRIDWHAPANEWQEKQLSPDIAGLTLTLHRHKPKYGVPGDRLHVKEHAWMWCEKRPNGTTEKGTPKFHYVPLQTAPVLYCADHPDRPIIDVVSPETGNQWGWRKKLGRFLPKWASRITLELTAVRVERLNDISWRDAIAEGIRVEKGAGWVTDEDRYLMTDGKYATGTSGARQAYQDLWESINGADSWALNPFVWVIEFRKVTA